MKREYKLESYKRKDGAFGWRIWAPNGNIFASSAEGDGYVTRSNAIRAARRLRVIAAEAVLVKG